MKPCNIPVCRVDVMYRARVACIARHQSVMKDCAQRFVTYNFAVLFSDGKIAIGDRRGKSNANRSV